MFPIGLYVPTRGHVWHQTASALGHFNPIYVRCNTGVADARSTIVAQFLESDAKVLVMCDDDVVPPEGWTKVVSHVQLGRTDVCAAVVPICLEHSVFLPNVFERNDSLPKGYQLNAEFLRKEGVEEVDAVGTGLIAIHRRVLEDKRMKGCFLADMSKGKGEDVLFCERAKKARYKISVDFDIWCDHMTLVHANGVANAYMEIVNRVSRESEA